MTVYLAGDSTMQFNDYKTYPQVGWGQVLPLFLKDEVKIVNYAKNGRSTRSFIFEKRLALISKQIKKGDFLFVQFGHNDQKEDERKTVAFKDYMDNLEKFVLVAKKCEAIPVLITSVYRRNFDESGNIKEKVHFDYPDAMIALAEKMNVFYIDICKMTKKILSDLGEQKSKRLYMNYPKGTYYIKPNECNDNTHLRYDGAYLISSLVVEELRKKGNPFANIIR